MADCHHLGDAVRVGSAEHGQVVIGEQGPSRIEWVTLTQRRPETRVFLRRAEVMRAMHLIEVLPEAGFRQLELPTAMVGIGGQPKIAPAAANRLQEMLAAGQGGNPVLHFRFHRDDVEPGEAAPVIEAVPVQGTENGFEFGIQPCIGFLEAEAMQLGVAPGYKFVPEMIVVGEVEDRAVHVEKDVVDGRPVDERCGHAIIIAADSTKAAMNPSELLESVLLIAIEAGRAILEVYESDFAATEKDDHSPLTQADLRAHHVIVNALATLTPDIPCLSEESAAVPFAERSAWTRYWLIDPLDGTKEFVKRNGEFTVNIALIEEHEAVLGVVHAPVLKVSYLAARGVGAFVIRDGERKPMHTRKTPERPVLVVTKSHRDAALDEFLVNAPEHEQQSRGSSLKLCMVAEGVADFYPRTGPTSEWDTAASHCVAEVAGASVLRLPEWQPLRYNTKDSLLNPGFVVIGDPAYGWREKLKKG